MDIAFWNIINVLLFLIFAFYITEILAWFRGVGAKMYPDFYHEK